MSIIRLGGLSRRLGGRATHPSVASRGSRSGAAVLQDQTGLDFPLNAVSGGDIRLLWNGANLLSRTDHTAIWKAKYKQQPSTYYAVAWHAYNDGTFHGDNYEFGTHPYPAANGTFDGQGSALTGDGGSSGNYWQELAGLGAHDYIALPMSAAKQLVPDGRWLTQARTCQTSGANLVHRFYPDVDNFPGDYIEKTVTLASLPSPSAPAFYYGSSDWTGSGSTNTETPGCVLRHMLLYASALDISTIQAKAALTSNDADAFYSNLNPTPTDVTDKSGSGHSPSWANANRPTLWSA